MGKKKLDRLVNTYEYLIKGTFVSKLSEKQVKVYYEKLLGIERYDGFSQLESAKQKGDGPGFIISSKDNELYLKVSVDKFSLTITNPLIKPEDSYSKSWDQLKSILDEIDFSTGFFANLYELDFAHTFFVLTAKKPSVVGGALVNKDIVNKSSFGFSLQVSYHYEDSSLSSGHYHQFLALLTGYPGGIESDAFETYMARLSPYFINSKYTLDSHEESQRLNKQEVYEFIGHFSTNCEDGRGDLLKLFELE
jgi:hypothetical protein